MTALQAILRQAQQALDSFQPVELDPVEAARAYFGEEAWHEANWWRKTGELPRSIRGLELLAIDIKLEEEV